MSDYAAYHRSITEELYSIKNRIRNLVQHWPTDGESKEVALRSLLRKHLPQSVTVGRGFIVTADQSSTQIDVLIVDASKPTLFKDGDLLIVTPDAVLGVIEVKTELRSESLIADALIKLAKVEELCRDTTGRDAIWTGLFVFEGNGNDGERFLKALGQAYEDTKRIIHCAAAGRDLFIRHWNRGRDVESLERGPVWHAYNLPQVAPSYFLGNLIDWISSVDNPNAQFAWFPALGGKEQYKTWFLPVGSSDPRQFNK
jgi:hypothetical protein